MFWSEEVFNGAKIREYAKREGVNPIHFDLDIETCKQKINT